MRLKLRFSSVGEVIRCRFFFFFLVEKCTTKSTKIVDIDDDYAMNLKLPGSRYVCVCTYDTCTKTAAVVLSGDDARR